MKSPEGPRSENFRPVRAARVVRAGQETNLVIRTGSEIRHIVPTDAEAHLIVQVRARDRSGNEGVSDPVTLQVVPDLEAPTLVASVPASGQAGFAGYPVVLRFSESIAPEALDPTRLRLLALGADAAPGGGDDTPVPLASAAVEGTIVSLDLPSARAGRYQLELEPGLVTDLSGHALAEAYTVVFDLLEAAPGTALWISDTDGFWSDAANWLHGRLPAQDDDAVLQRFGAKPRVTLNSNAIVKNLLIATPFATAQRAALTVLRDLRATETVSIPADAVRVDGSALFEKPLEVNGGELRVSKRLETRSRLALSRGGTLTLAGPDAQFVAAGGLQGANFSVVAQDGARIDLPDLVAYDGPGDFTPLFPVGTLFSAVGLGSRLTLPSLVSGSGPVDWNARGAPALVFQAASGGHVVLPALAALSHRVRLVASGFGSLLAAPALTSVIGTEPPFQASIEATADGRVEAPQLSVIDQCPITESGGGVVVRPGPRQPEPALPAGGSRHGRNARRE